MPLITSGPNTAIFNPLFYDPYTARSYLENTCYRTHGCICCTLREDLLLEVEKLAHENRFDYLLIESTGISEPLPMAQTFSFVSEDGAVDLSRFSRLDTLVTVVDTFTFTFTFTKDFGGLDRLPNRQFNEADPQLS